MRTAIDSSALSALFGEESSAKRIAEILFQQRQQGGLYICAQVYAELAARYEPKVLMKQLEQLDIYAQLQTTFDVLGTAAERWHKYLARRRKGDAHYPCEHCGRVNTFRCEGCREVLGGPRLILADFLIGADAHHRAGVLIALDRGVYRAYFPEITVITWEEPSLKGPASSES